MFNLLDTVVLTRDVPDAGLRRGDLGAIVEVYGPNAFEVEFVAASGRTQALVTLAADDLRHVDDHDLIAVRTLEQAAANRPTRTGPCANNRLNRREVQPFLDALEPLLHTVDARVNDRIVAVQVRHLFMQVGDLGLDGSEALLDRCEIVLDLAHVRAYGPKMIENQVFDVVGHGNTPPRKVF